MGTTRDEQLKWRAKKVIPNAMYGHQSTATLPPPTPQFFSKARGAYLWDYDGNRYLDLMSAYGPNLFGYANEIIDAAYIDQLSRIDTATAPSHLLVELSERFVNLIEHADWAIHCKNGTDATSAALMICRAHKGRKKILFASGAYHGSATWCTPVPSGTVAEDRMHFIEYSYNDPDSLAEAAAEAGDDLAGIFASPFKHDILSDQALPTQEYAEKARTICDDMDALLVIDDVRAGFRIARDCSWSSMGVQPDLSAWGKAIANGHPLSCLLGSDRARAAASSIFVTGSFWFSSAPMAACLKTLDLIESTDYLEKIVSLGDHLRVGLGEISEGAGLNVRQTGPSQMPMVLFYDDDDNLDVPQGMAFAELMIKRGVYFHPYHNMFINASMTEADIDFVLERARQASREL